MEVKRAIEVLKMLADGIDPYTGEIFSKDSAYQQADTVRSLIMAVAALEAKRKNEQRQRALPVRAGMSWSEEEDRKLILEFNSGKSLKDISREHDRTIGSIHSRLVRLGKITIE